MNVIWSTEGPLAAEWKEWWLLKQEKQSCVVCLTQAVLSQLFGWKCCSMMMPSIMRMDVLQLDSWCAVFQSTNEMLVTSFRTLDIQRYVHDVFLRASQSNWKPREEPFLPCYWYVFKLRERPSHPGLLTADETWFHHFELETQRQSAEWRCRHSPQKKEFKHFYQWARSWSLSSVIVQEGFLWQQCWDGR